MFTENNQIQDLSQVLKGWERFSDLKVKKK